MKRISIVLVICMLMSMIPTMAFADTETAVAEEITVTEETATDVAATEETVTEEEPVVTEESETVESEEIEAVEPEVTESITPNTAEYYEEECDHYYCEAEFYWYSNYTCNAKVYCCDCGESKSILDCKVTKTVAKKATCKTTGKYKYTAEVTAWGQTFTDYKYATISKAAHKYSGNKRTVCGVKLLATPAAKASKYSWSKIKISWNKVANASGYYWCYASRYYGFNYYKIED